MCQRRLDLVGLVLKRDVMCVSVGDGRGAERERKRRWGQGGKREWDGRETCVGKTAVTGERAAVTGARLFLSSRSELAMRSYDVRAVQPLRARTHLV